MGPDNGFAQRRRAAACSVRNSSSTTSYYNAGRLHALCINYAVHAPDNFVSVDYVKNNDYIENIIAAATAQASCGCCEQLDWVTPSTG